MDTDKDGLYDKEEEAYGTNINNKDTDGDGYADLSELGNGFDPNKKQP
ncbi:calcium-binding protein [Candidatus Falkowbacteria bacterium CG11_big_fil_rev_8_21_14_0_20_39_10]|uniref:Calcium-binding protein n=1 Tax=Candidatus Falkowbacteria bacterium CG11_big_fil_rev_8_21_14_0_20_39_10 TaxID=1974570 RepID=A0A2M6K9H1_9BACT|nr:MAG: calcium-binding protein [Candidatus Falkowbacteria bacterium CG11_big_fil_rev_8_21_14_0_20_39_10]